MFNQNWSTHLVVVDPLQNSILVHYFSHFTDQDSLMEMVCPDSNLCVWKYLYRFFIQIKVLA